MRLIVLFLFLFVVALAMGCNKSQAKSKPFPELAENEIPNNVLFVLDGNEDLIDSSHIIIAKQWHDFKDGSIPGIYYILAPKK